MILFVIIRYLHLILNLYAYMYRHTAFRGMAMYYIYDLIYKAKYKMTGKVGICTVQLEFKRKDNKQERYGTLN